jgi:hypothetical protein
MDTQKPKRVALSKKTRFDVFKRDLFACQYCGAHPPSVLLHVDHISPVALGGKNNIDNLVTACQPCNLGKGARSLGVVPQSLAEKAKETAEREEQLACYQQILEAKRLRIENEVWRVLRLLFGQSCTEVASDEHGSVKRFIERLGVHEVLDAADIAMGSRVSTYKLFRYFCGVCWNKIRSQEELANA